MKGPVRFARRWLRISRWVGIAAAIATLLLAAPAASMALESTVSSPEAGLDPVELPLVEPAGSGQPEAIEGEGPVPSLASVKASQRKPADSIFSDSLVIQGSPVEGLGLRAQQEIERSAPEAFFARMRSRTEFMNVGAAKAARIDRSVFPGLVGRRAAGAPVMRDGARIVRYASSTVAELDLPGGRRGAVESVSPIARPVSHGRYAPLDLGLKRHGGGYMPSAPAVAVSIPEHLDQGVTARASGVSLVPANSRGVALRGAAGDLQAGGASVLYANSQTDSDTVAKPTSGGFEISTVLRSERSPRTLYFKVRMPRGDRLVRQSAGSVKVVGRHGVVGRVLAPVAQDASGALVPATMRVAGRMLVINLDISVSAVRWPVEVDPEYWAEDRLTPGSEECQDYGKCTWGLHNWTFIASNPSLFQLNEVSPYWQPVANYSGGEWAGFQYETQGESKIWAFEATMSGGFGSPADVEEELQKPIGEGKYERENHRTQFDAEKGEFAKTETICGTFHPEGHTCEATEGYSKNLARFMTYLTGAGGYHTFYAEMAPGLVWVSQEKGPEAKFNTSRPTFMINGARPNVLYGSGGWLGPNTGAFEVEASDPGVGVSEIQLWNSSHEIMSGGPFRAGLCAGIQCQETYSSPLTYTPGMEDGEHTLRFVAKDGVGATGSVEATFKIDGTPPRSIGFTGMPEVGAEISAAPHTLTIHATDGTAPAKSSGVQSIAVSIDGGPKMILSGTECAPGECTASGQYVLHAENLAEGVHRLTVTAIDNANNEASKAFYFDVRHASPVSVGPGEVDPTTGQFTMAASDVSLGGNGVSRSYQSRELTAGVGGPLGPQWAMSVGGGEGLSVLPNGSVELSSESGGTTTFTLNSKGEFEAPKGDEGLKIEYKSSEHKYLLKDASAGSETVFEQPTGMAETAPLYANQFGTEGVQLHTPESIAVDPSGDVWVTDVDNNRILKFSATGTLLGAYGEYGSGAGQMIDPWGIAVNQSTGNVYVTDQGNSRIDVFSSSGAFIKTIGWGVQDGRPQLESCSSECQAGIAGSGAGQFSTLAGIAVDSSGDLLVADFGNNRIQELSEGGGYLQSFGSEGTGGGQFKGPTNIALSGGNLYITDYNNARVQELSTSGGFLKAIGWGVSNGESKLEVCTSSCRAGISGAGNGQFDLPRGIAAESGSGDLYVSDMGNNRVQEITPSGSFITRFGSSGSGEEQFDAPGGVAVSSAGGIYVVDRENNRVQEWMRSTWLATSAKGSLGHQSTYTYKLVKEAEGSTIEPSEVISPPPAGVTCGTEPGELKDGCRALTFNYAETTTAKGEKPSEWGDYLGHLTRVYFHAYNPSGKAMETIEVAHYLYDAQGRLRAEWDPRISPALKTTYGYDAEGHLTAVTPPGQQPWVLTYGTIADDSNTGRLLKVTRGHPEKETSEEVKKKLEEEQEAAVNTEAPTLSGTPAVGVRMSVSTGRWSHSPVVYAFQWEDCNSTGKECTPILGANNANYTPVSTDAGHTLVAKVTATNTGGSTVTSSAASSVVASTAGAYTQTVDSGYGLNAVSCIPGSTDCVLSDSAGKALYATNVSASGAASWSSWSGPGASPSEALDCPSTGLCLLADAGDLYYASSLGGSWTDAFSPSYGVIALSCASASFCIDGQGGSGGYIRYSTAPGSTSWTAEKIAGSSNVNGVLCLSSSFCAAVDSSGYARIATSTAQIESASWTSTDIDGSSALNGIACASASSCVAVDGAGNVLDLTVSGTGAVTSAAKHNIDGTTSLTAVACAGSTTCVTVDSSGNVFVSQNAGETWAKEYTLGGKLTGVSCASSSLCATANTTGEVTAFKPSGAGAEGESQAPQVGTTIEYQVPVSGAGAPHNMSAEEVEKWGQKDKSEQEDNDPVEATAVFPANEPQSWPATKYTRATIYYMNAKGLTVNAAAPSGGIATSEYNALNETIRTLSADNRATALAEGCESVKEHKCKSAEAAEKLQSQTEYNAEGSQVLRTLGPEHEMRMPWGENVQARAVTHYSYDEGAKEAESKTGETYNLVTETRSAALLTNHTETESPEQVTRTTKTSYSGQEGLGWKLRKPTSVTQDPSGLKLTTTTRYNENTGQIIETQSADGHIPVAYLNEWGSKGSGQGQFSVPRGGLATASNGDVYVSDTENARVEEFTPEGEFIRDWGSYGTGNGQFTKTYGLAIAPNGDVYVSDQDRIQWFTAEGSYRGQFAVPNSGGGIAIEKNGNVLVTDSGANCVDEYSSEGKLERSFGSEGEGKLRGPSDVAIGTKGEIIVDDEGARKIEVFNSEGKYIREFGSGQFSGDPWGISIGPEGYVWVADTGNNDIKVFSPTGESEFQFGKPGGEEPGDTEAPVAVAVNSNFAYVLVEGEGRPALERWQHLNPTVHDTKTIYYTAGSEAGVEACDNHPEWANLPCRTEPGAQPEDVKEGKPALPITTETYNIWDEPETTTETFGSITRTKTQTYDAAGRALTSQETSSVDKALPTTTVEYNTETGAVEKQTATINGVVKTIAIKDNTLGQLVEYQDGTGNVAKYTYEEGGDGRLLEVSEGKGEEAASKQTYSYNETTGLMSKLVDSAAGTFTASYDLEGKITNEIYPNGMCANTSYNSTGQATSMSYIKTRNCAEEHPTVWFSDSVVPGAHGERLSQTSTLSSEGYAYDAAGRLIETQETPAGKGCTTRLYAYDEESNRLSMTTREPGSEGKCATEGGIIQHHLYDEANRLTDEGVEYEALGNTIKLPAADAGGKEITSSFYVDGQTATQEQNGVQDSYTYDPAGRTMETTAENIATKATATAVSHYAGPGEAVSWTSQGEEKWSRNISGIGGSLQATEESTKVVTLQLADLQGNIVATAADNEAETKLLSTYNSTEFGEPSGGKAPPKYAWLGAGGLATVTAFGTGVITQAGASYVPQIARGLQTAQVTPPGAFPELAPGNQYTATVSPGILASAQEEATQLWQQAEAERQKQREREAEEALEQCEADRECAPEFGDPEGILTGKQALNWAKKLSADALEVEAYLDAGYCGKGTGCEYWVPFLEAAEEIDGEASELLRGCAAQVHKGRWRKNKWGLSEYQNAVCYYHYTTVTLKSVLGGGPTEFSTFGPVEACWSPELEAGTEWACPGHGLWFF